jgi:hypothetical protein
MTDADLDKCYSTLAAALGDVGEGSAPLLLSMLCLALMARAESASQVLPLIGQARARLAQGPGNDCG